MTEHMLLISPAVHKTILDCLSLFACLRRLTLQRIYGISMKPTVNTAPMWIMAPIYYLLFPVTNNTNVAGAQTSEVSANMRDFKHRGFKVNSFNAALFFPLGDSPA
jgi:hypothetical protein